MYTVLYVGPDAGFLSVKELFQKQNSRDFRLLHIPATAEAVAPALKDAHAFLDASMVTRITDTMIAAAPSLKVISCATTGSDHIDRGEINRRNIAVRTLKEDKDLLKNLTPAAELSWALLMACARKLIAAQKHVVSGKWARVDFPGIMLRGKKLGIVGCGRIGGWMARYAAAFGMEVRAYDPLVEKFPEGVTKTSLEELVSVSDFISVHVHLTEATRRLISRPLFDAMKPGVIIINTSRGGVIDEQALLDNLLSGKVAAAGLDVLDGEPDIAGHPLVKYAMTHDNLIITPHCGGYSLEAVSIVCQRAAQKVLDYFK